MRMERQTGQVLVREVNLKACDTHIFTNDSGSSVIKLGSKLQYEKESHGLLFLIGFLSHLVTDAAGGKKLGRKLCIDILQLLHHKATAKISAD